MFRMTVADIFFIRGRGLVATGKVESGTLRTGDEVAINGGTPVSVDAIEAFRRVLDEAHEGDNVGLLIRKLDKDDVKAGDVLTAAGGPSDDGLAKSIGLSG